MLYLGKWTEKTTHTALAEGTRIMCFSYLDIGRNIFQVSPVDCWDQCYTDSEVDWDGILAAAMGKVRCPPCCSWPCPHVLGSGSVVVLWSPRAGTPLPLSHSKECGDPVCSAAPRGDFRVRESCSLLILWQNADLQVGKNLPSRAGRVGRPSPFRGSSGCWGLTWLGSLSRDCCVTRSFLLALC